MKYTNPVIPGFHPDPSVCKKGEDYYLVTSSFEYFPGVPVFHSRDLIHWEQIGHCLTRRSQLDLEGAPCAGGIFAPTLRYHNGLFYMITTNVSGRGNFYVTAKDPAGEWSDPVWVDEGFFDPSLLFDDDGKVYYTRRQGESIVQAEIDINTGKLLTDLRVVREGMCSPDVEGPHLYKINGMYYMMCAEGGTRRGHMETIGRSTSPWGPFQPCPHNPILTHRNYTSEPIRDTGHAELVEAHDGSWWAFFLGTRHYEYDGLTHLGRETFLTPVTWTEDGWPVVNEGKPIKLEMVCKAALKPESRKQVEPVRDNFDSRSLRLCWNYIRNPVEENYSLSERPGFLRLWGAQHKLEDSAVVTFLGRRQTQFVCTISALLEFTPESENEEAGLAVYMSSTHHYAMGVRKQEDQRVVFVRKRVDDLRSEHIEHIPGNGAVTLQIDADERKYYFSYSVGGEMKELSTGIAKYISAELAGGWNGVMMGMYASGNGKKSNSPVDFDWFDYSEIE
mgnify:CR=1 FL=1